MDARILNRLLELRVKDMAAHPSSGSPEERRLSLCRCLGLDPLPIKSELNAEVTGTLLRDGYRIEKVRFDSLPDVPVTAHLYLPDGEKRRPVILRPHGHWEFKKAGPEVQANAIGLALSGFACFVVDSPGVSWDDNPSNERRAMGTHDDAFLNMGWTVQSQYIWDLMRAIDYLETRPDIDVARIGITGESGGGAATMYAFGVDRRISVAVPVVSVASLEMNVHLGCLCNHVPGIMGVGDRSDIFGIRASDGAVMVIAAVIDEEFPIEGHLRTDEKLRKIFRGLKRESKFRFERFPGGHDYNRRMREAALAFFSEQLEGSIPMVYRPEPRPLTDGHLNPFPSGTEDPTALEFHVIEGGPAISRTFRDLLAETMARPTPEAYRVDQRLVPWRKFGETIDIRPGAILAIHDETVATPSEPSSIALPIAAIDQRLCILLGLSVAEFLAQYIHVCLPGGPDGWESSGTGVAGDVFTSMLASVKTLVSSPEAAPKLVVAEGPVASMAARFLARYRPSLQVKSSHLWTSWNEAFTQGIPQNAQPNARYLDWI